MAGWISFPALLSCHLHCAHGPVQLRLYPGWHTMHRGPPVPLHHPSISHSSTTGTMRRGSSSMMPVEREG